MLSLHNIDGLHDAEMLLKALDPTTNRFTFQTFDDVHTRRDPFLARILHGSLQEHHQTLRKLNGRRAGIFICVNATDLRGRSSEYIVRVRSVWQDDDAGWDRSFPLRPSMAVRTSPGKFQRYWLCDGLSFAEHRAVMERLSRDFGNDPGAKDLPRVMRLPSFHHCKEKPHKVELIECSGARYTREEILGAFPPFPPEQARNAAPLQSDKNEDLAQVREAIEFIPADDRDLWLRVGMALKSGFGEAGRDLWDDWAANSKKYDYNDQTRTWRSLKRDEGIRLGTLFHLAREAGFRFGGRNV